MQTLTQPHSDTHSKAMNAQHIYAHGKLMLTGEYFVLDGANVLSISTRFGQHLRAKSLTGESNTLYWIALNNLKLPWLNLAFDKDNFFCINSDAPEATTLTKILSKARELNPAFLTDRHDIAVETYLEFPNDWGLGSSSTLIYCIAQWAKIDGYMLLQQTMGGSGYDVANAGSDTPILYHLNQGKPQWEQIEFNPPFAEQLYFVHTNQKQVSSKGIKHYREMAVRKTDCVAWLNKITESTLQCQSLRKMEQLMQEHENIISEELKMPKVKDTLFPDYWGAAKSLGAWGGDFVMLTNDRSEEELLSYLHAKNLHVVHRFDKMLFRPR